MKRGTVFFVNAEYAVCMEIFSEFVTSTREVFLKTTNE